VKIHLLLVLLWFAQSCSTPGETLVWSDEFEGSGLPDSARWSYDLGSSGFGNNEIQEYTDKLQNVRQENGVLIIEALKSDSAWTSARITTRNKYEFTNGRIVFRARVPVGSGTWPALWLLGANIDSVGWPACGEIDVMEHVGRNPGSFHTTVHTPSNFGTTKTMNTDTLLMSNFNTEFHLYEANWKPDRIEFKIDNNHVYTYQPEIRNDSTWPCDKPFYIIMNIAMGGSWGSDLKYESKGLKNGIDPSLTSARLEIDFVRIYK
jgi:beta-glucanase (GH16 family)